MCGIKHCGKSTQGKKISAALGLSFYDTDDLIYEHTGYDARSLYKSQGKEAFMQAELEACQFLLDALNKNEAQAQDSADILQAKNCGKPSEPSKTREPRAAVIATGGGICENQKAVKILKDLGTIVYLKIKEAAACERIIREARFLPDGSIQNLPAYIANKNPRDKQEIQKLFHDFFVERTKKYEALCDISVQMQGSREKNCKKILAALGLD